MTGRTYRFDWLIEAWERASLGNAILDAALLVALSVIGAGLFLDSGLVVFDDAGSAADWFAAVGTWVIGFGAIRLAAGDRRQRDVEFDRLQLRDCQLSSVRVKAALGILEMLPIAYEGIERAERSESGMYRASDVLGAIAATEPVYRSFRFDVEDKAVLQREDAGEDAIQRLEVALIHYIDQCASFKEWFDVPGTEWIPANSAFLRGLIQTSSVLRQRAEEVRHMASAEAERLKHEIGRISARLAR